MSAVPPVRPDLDLAEGYHSPQVEAEVRLNTNESPFAPPDAWREELLAALEEVSFNRYPDRPATELRQAVADLHGVSPDEVFCANGSNEVLQCLLLAFGGPGPARPGLRADLRAALAHRAHHRHRGGRGVARRRLPDRPRRRRGAARRRAARHHVPLLAEQPDRAGRAARDRRRRACGRARASSSSTRPTGSSPRGRRSSCAGRRTPGWWSPARSPRPGPWPAPASATWWPTRPWSPACEAVVLPVPPVGADPAGRAPGPAPRARDGVAGGPHRRGAGPGGRRPGRPAGGQLALRRQLHPLPPPRPRRRRGLALAPRPVRPDPQLRQLGRPARAACASPSGPPRRTTASCTP